MANGVELALEHASRIISTVKHSQWKRSQWKNRMQFYPFNNLTPLSFHSFLSVVFLLSSYISIRCLFTLRNNLTETGWVSYTKCHNETQTIVWRWFFFVYKVRSERNFVRILEWDMIFFLGTFKISRCNLEQKEQFPCYG